MIGTVYEVSDEVLTAELVVSASSGEEILWVNDVSQFSELSQGGGTLRINWVDSYDYLDIDPLTGEIFLADPLTDDYALWVKVQPMPEARQKTAMVMLAGSQEDAIDAVVTHSLYDRIATGIRAEGLQEVVQVDLVNRRYTVIDVLDRSPVIDSSFLDEIPLSDGDAPATSPTPDAIGGIGSIFVRWTAIANADPVTYDVHVSATTGFTPNGGNLYASTDATSINVRNLPGGGALTYGTDYFFKIIARDDDGAAAASSQDSAQMMQVSGPDVSAAYVYAGNLFAGQILSDELQATLTITGMLKTATSGRRVELDASGLRLYSSDGITRTVDFPTAVDQVAQIVAKMTATSLTVQKDFNLLGESNQIKGTLTLAEGIVPPTVSPSVSYSHEFVGFRPLDFGSIHYGLTTHLSDATLLLSAHAFFGAGISAIVRATGAASAFPLWVGTKPWQAGFNAIGGITTQSGKYFILGFDSDRSDGYYLYRLNSTFDLEAELFLGVSSLFPGRPVVGNDGTNVLVALAVPDNTIRVVPINPSTLVVGTQTDYVFNSIFSTPLHYVGKGSFAYGATRLVVGVEGYGNFVYLPGTAPTGGAVQAGNTFIRANNSSVRGLWWDGTRFWSHNADGTTWKHGVSIVVQSSTSTYTWYDGDTSSGSLVHETLPSPVTAFNWPAGTFLNVRTEEAPDSGVTDALQRDKANRVGVYVGVATPRRLQSYLGVDGDGRTIRNLILDTANTGSATEPTAPNGFAGATNSPGTFQTFGASTSKGVKITGDGSMVLGGPITGDAVARDKINLGASNINLSGTTNSTLTGLSFTRSPPSSATKYEITLQGWLAPTATHTILAELLVNGTPETDLLVQAGNGSAGYTWLITGLTPAASYTFTFRARMAAVGQTGIVSGTHTSAICRRTG